VYQYCNTSIAAGCFILSKILPHEWTDDITILWNIVLRTELLILPLQIIVRLSKWQFVFENTTVFL
jgi:hypothetical protein